MPSLVNTLLDRVSDRVWPSIDKGRNYVNGLIDRFLLLIHIALVLTAVVLFVIGVSVSVRAGFEIENDSILFEQSTNATAPRPNMRRTMELQVSMHGAYWNNRSMLVDDFFGLTMEAWGIGTDPDSFMVLDNDETCIMMYQKWDTRKRNFSGKHVQLRTRTCLYHGDPSGRSVPVQSPSPLYNETIGTAVGKTWLDLKMERTTLEGALTLPMAASPMWDPYAMQKIERDSHACRYHYSTANKIANVPHKLQLSVVHEVQEYFPDVLLMVQKEHITPDTKIEMRGLEYKWERWQTGIIPKYNIKFKTDLWILYYLEKHAARGCCVAPRSLEYSIRLYSHGLDEFDPEMLEEIFERYKKISRTKYARERTTCDSGDREMLLWGVGFCSCGVLLLFAVIAHRVFYRRDEPVPPAPEGHEIEMHSMEQ